MIQELDNIQNPTLRERFERAIVKKALQAKLKLGVGLPQRKAKQQALDNINDIEPKRKEATPKNKAPKNKNEKTPKTKTEDKKELTLKEKQILADELHKQFKKPKQLRKINFKSKDNIWNADLIIMPIDSGYKYVLTILDGYTRYAWAVPLKHKDAVTVVNAFKQIIKISKRKPNKLFVDQGKEFYNQQMYELFEFKNKDVLEKDKNGEYKNHIYSVFNFGKNPVIERFNRTLTNKLWKQFTINGNQKWLHILQPTIKKYNNTIHRTINTTPSLASKDPSLVKVKPEPIYNIKPKFKVNDRVRIFKWKNKFEKGYKGYWTKEIFKITEVKNTNPVMYTIQDLNNENIKGSFYQNELMKTYF